MQVNSGLTRQSRWPIYLHMVSQQFSQGLANKGRRKGRPTSSGSNVQHTLWTISDRCEMEFAFKGHIENVMHLKYVSVLCLLQRLMQRGKDLQNLIGLALSRHLAVKFQLKPYSIGLGRAEIQ